MSWEHHANPNPCPINQVKRDIFTSLIGTCATSVTALRHHGELPSIADGRANSQALCLSSTCWKGVIIRVYLVGSEWRERAVPLSPHELLCPLGLFNFFCPEFSSLNSFCTLENLITNHPTSITY